MFLRRKTTISGNWAASYTASTRSCGEPAGRREPINCNKVAAYMTTRAWRQINGRATLCTTTTATFLLTAHPVDWCECPISTNLAVNKQEREMKAYMFARESQGKVPMSTKRNHRSTSSDHGNNKGTRQEYQTTSTKAPTATTEWGNRDTNLDFR